MKVLFIGHYREQSGWGRAACEYILALDEVGVDVVCRSVKLNPVQAKIPERIKELEQKSDKDCDICIQNLLPHHLHYHGAFKKNICIPFIDTFNLEKHVWLSSFENFEIWSPYEGLSDALKALYLNSDTISRDINPTEVVPVPCDPSKYLTSQKKLDINVNLEGKFIFYSIFDLTPRKNLLGLLKAWHTAFQPWEDVALVIKTGKYGKSPDDVRKQVIDMNNKICMSLKLYEPDLYNKPVIITEHLSDEQVDQLHILGDCFVLPSFGEAWCLPAFDAVGFGKRPIVTENTACQDYIDSRVGTLVTAIDAPVSGMTDTFPEIFNANERWWEPSIVDLAECMRSAYKFRNLDFYREEGLNRVQEFSRQNVGRKMKEILETNV